MAFNKNDEFGEFLEELKFKCDIVQIIGQYVPLTKKSNKYFGCCPFHNEKTGSFCVNVDGQYYHCFGCGASGNVINFIMEIESLSFMDAVKFLADKVGMTLPEFKGDPNFKQKKDEKEVLNTLMVDAARYYRSNLLKEVEGKDARDYLLNRGINDEVSQRFGLGLSLNESGLQGYMRRKGYSVKQLQDCGLIYGNDNIDSFSNRIIVPIIDAMGHVVAFGGRIYHGEKDLAKYKNSTNNVVFNKGRTLFGVNYIKKERRNNGGFNEIILVEGYMDVISLATAGILNVVAGMGTALTEGQANQIKRLCSKVFVCYDGDEAGHKATIRNIDILKEQGLECRVVSLDDGLDPDDTIKKEGATGFQKKLDEALPVLDYKLKLCQEAVDLNTSNGRARFIRMALKVLEEVDSSGQKEVYIEKVAKIANVSKEAIVNDFNKFARNKKEEVPEAIVKEAENKVIYSAKYVLYALLNNKPYAKIELLKREWLSIPTYQLIYDFIVQKGQGEINISDLFDEVGTGKEINDVLNFDMSFDNTLSEEDYFMDCVANLANEYLKGRLDYLKKEYDNLSDKEEKEKTIKEIGKLTKQYKSKNIFDKLD